MNRVHVAMNRKRKMADERGSLEKFVGGVTLLITKSCIVLKSSIQF